MAKQNKPDKAAEAAPLPKFGLAEDILGPEAKKAEDAPREKKKGTNGSGNGLDTSEKYVTFFLDREEYALPIGIVREINRVSDITRVPNAPEHVLGVMNLRGRIVPVLELKRRLSLGATHVDKESRIVVVEFGPKVLGLLVDSVAQVMNLNPEQFEEAPDEIVSIERNYIKGVGKLDDRMIILLELDKVVSAAGQAAAA